LLKLGECFVAFIAVATALLLNSVTLAAGNTIWWNTVGGSVVEHEENGYSCILTLTNSDGVVEFIWQTNKQTQMGVIRQDWNLPKREVKVAVKLGDTWLDAGQGLPNIDAIQGGDIVVMALTDSVDAALQASDGITVKIDNEQYFSMALTKRKMTALLQGVRKCRASIRGK
jgi:hypothetical protein